MSEPIHFDIEVVYNQLDSYGCSSCKHVKNSIFKEPCVSCRIDYEKADHKPTRYEPKLCSTNTTDCESYKIGI